MNNLNFNIRLLVDDEVREIEYEEEQRKLCLTLKLDRLSSRSKSVFNLPDTEFRNLFRINKVTLERIILELTPFLKLNRRSDGISVETKVITTVRFLAQGAYQRGVGKESDVSLSRPSVSKVLNEVIDCVNLHLPQKYIKFPTSPMEPMERQRIKDWFRTKYHISGVIGIIDGSQIGIFPLATNDNQFPEFVYVNHKSHSSIYHQRLD